MFLETILRFTIVFHEFYYREQPAARAGSQVGAKRCAESEGIKMGLKIVKSARQNQA